VQLVHARFDLLDGHAEFLREVNLLILGVRQEFVERGIEEPDGHRVALEGAEDAGEVVALVGEDLGEGGLAGLDGLGEIISRMASIRSPSKNMCSAAAEADARAHERNRVLGL